MATLYYTDIAHPDIIQQRVIISLLHIKIALNPLKQKEVGNDSVFLVDGNMILTDPNAISIYLIKSTKMLGNDVKEQIKIYSLLEYYNLSIYPLLK
jgi:hypothetical protein